MEISAEKTKLMKNNTSGINKVIKVNGQKLETVTIFKCLGSVVSAEGFNPESTDDSSIDKADTSLEDRSISVSSKIRLMRFLVIFSFLYACESWTLLAGLRRGIRATEMRCYRKVLRISYKNHVTTENVYAKIQEDHPETPDHRKETQTEVVWTCLPFIRSVQSHLTSHSERGKKTRQTENEMGRQHLGTDRP